MIAQRLPNGFIVLLMTPREATCLSDELLEPGQFPWQHSESVMVAGEARHILRDLVSEDAQFRLQEASNAMVAVAQEQEQQRNVLRTREEMRAAGIQVDDDQEDEKD